MNEEDSAKGGTQQRPVSQVQSLKQGKPDMGDWDNFSNLDNTEQMEGMSQVSSEFGKLGGGKQGDLMGAIKGAKASDDLKEIDDDFEIDPDVD